ncbi:hypothetical protein E3N88_26411 [Mikania micrantha]|uniref:Uncharacterized protein n=1 Tax=Mikania micrantha TaxID=192012 RepID=A0A5N6N8I7_9ASTR|nr:hypothetical protein E3N88_26411 [Mikania micrantha]
MSAVCGPHLQTSAEEELDQMSAVCKKQTVCFLTWFAGAEIAGDDCHADRWKFFNGEWRVSVFFIHFRAHLTIFHPNQNPLYFGKRGEYPNPISQKTLNELKGAEAPRLWRVVLRMSVKVGGGRRGSGPGRWLSRQWRWGGEGAPAEMKRGRRGQHMEPLSSGGGGGDCAAIGDGGEVG